MTILSILNDFSEFPGLRHFNISDNSGEEFYHRILNKAFKDAYEKGEKLILDLDNTAGYAPSFLDEAIGNLVLDFSLANVKKYLEIISNQEPEWKQMIENQTYIEWENRRINNSKAKKTMDIEPWFRLVDGEIKQSIW